MNSANNKFQPLLPQTQKILQSIQKVKVNGFSKNVNEKQIQSKCIDISQSPENHNLQLIESKQNKCEINKIIYSNSPDQEVNYKTPSKLSQKDQQIQKISKKRYTIFYLRKQNDQEDQKIKKMFKNLTDAIIQSNQDEQNKRQKSQIEFSQVQDEKDAEIFKLKDIISKKDSKIEDLHHSLEELEYQMQQLIQKNNQQKLPKNNQLIKMKKRLKSLSHIKEELLEHFDVNEKQYYQLIIQNIRVLDKMEKFLRININEKKHK
ncbi:UNKNOWN [Stylonychia lemnae]|uniref:Uncharacterized protein n=1 Tax=Stylonychia lemnae TaxID=5949 RepID=A0A078AS40_STYLE|nr:UNKNOWN [Stylonychia lemnae]|eukprot:CDW84984.1 UNKNOWN [Stylonychia lemnae]